MPAQARAPRRGNARLKAPGAWPQTTRPAGHARKAGRCDGASGPCRKASTPARPRREAAQAVGPRQPALRHLCRGGPFMAWQHAIPVPGLRARERPARHCRLPLKRPLARHARISPRGAMPHARPASGGAAAMPAGLGRPSARSLPDGLRQPDPGEGPAVP